VEILHRRFFEGKAEMLALLERERINAKLAQKVYDLRTATGPSQRELAEKALVGRRSGALLIGMSIAAIELSRRMAEGLGAPPTRRAPLGGGLQ
jgi:hypothetical protein